MSRTRRRSGEKPEPRRLRVRSVRRNPPDVRKLAGALIALAQAAAEADAETGHRAHREKPATGSTSEDGDAA